MRLIYAKCTGKVSGFSMQFVFKSFWIESWLPPLVPSALGNSLNISDPWFSHLLKKKKRGKNPTLIEFLL